MGRFVKLNLDEWQPPDRAANPANPAKLANPGPGADDPALAALAALADLPDDLADGLRWLARMAPPRLLSPDAWPVVVADAQWLASEGLAGHAISLGWQPLDLFGAVPDNLGDADADGLAVKLGGRRILAICSKFARVRDRDGKRAWIYPGNNSGAVLLWDLGCGRAGAKDKQKRARHR